MLINADFSRRAIVTPQQYRWLASPQAGVERVMLDRIGAEKGRATSIVHYAPDTGFPDHRHPGGEEILVLSGTFCEGDAHYPAGWYLRNPPGSGHQTSSPAGALIFVKLAQMPRHEQQSVRIDTRAPNTWRRQDGRELCPLFYSPAEQVGLHRLAAYENLPLMPSASIELLILTGGMMMEASFYESGSWIRLPPGDSPEFTAGAEGATVYLKTRPSSAQAIETSP